MIPVIASIVCYISISILLGIIINGLMNIDVPFESEKIHLKAYLYGLSWPLMLASVVLVVVVNTVSHFIKRVKEYISRAA